MFQGKQLKVVETKKTETSFDDIDLSDLSGIISASEEKPVKNRQITKVEKV